MSAKINPFDAISNWLATATRAAKGTSIYSGLIKNQNSADRLIAKIESENSALLLAVDNFLAEGRPHGGRNTQFPDGCECDICQNWDTLNRERQAIGAKP